MRFQIRQTRNFGDDPEAPAPGATVELDERNHRRWYIELDSLEDLMELVKAVDSEVIVSTGSRLGGFPELEVYNDYRE